MKYFELLALHFILFSVAGAEPVLPRVEPSGASVPEQRRAELRSVLQVRDTTAATQAHESADRKPRLSDQDRFDLRNQLRWRRQDDPSRTP